MSNSEKFQFKKYAMILLRNIISVSLVFGQFGFLRVEAGGFIHPDTGLSIVQFLQKYRYPLETHQVVTDDGYILTIHRIPHGRYNFNLNSNIRPPVLLVHGLLGSSMDFINTGPKNALALNLADKGYDVWLANCRGNTWSRNHTFLKPNIHKEFWDFSFNEIGFYDLPVTIDYVLRCSERKKLSYVGFSQGTTSFFAMGSMKPEYNRKIKIMAAMAPVAYMQHMQSPIAIFIIKNFAKVKRILDSLNVFELFPHEEWMTNVGRIFCNSESKYREICAYFIYLFGGFDPDQLDKDLIPVILTSSPAGASRKQFEHYLQEMVSGKFCQYDYGPKFNSLRYINAKPNEYNTSQVTSPVALFYSENDFFAALNDLQRLVEKLPNVVSKYKLPLKSFSHLDFLWAKNVDILVNEHIIKLLDNYNY